MDSSQLYKNTDLLNLSPDAGRTDAMAAVHPPAWPDAAGLSGQEYEQFFDLSLDLLSVASLDEECLQRVNPAWTACLGWSAAELTSRPWLDFVHPDDHAVTAKSREQLMQGKTLHEFENRYCCKDGSFKRLSWNVRPAVDSQRLFCIARDVTEKALLEERCRNFFEQAAVGMVIASESGRFLQVNQRFADMLGYTRQEMAGGLCAEVTHADDREHEAACFEKLINKHTDAHTWEKRYVRQDGSVVWCALSLSLLSLQGDGTRQFVGVVEDISVKKRAQESLQRSQTMLRIAGNTAKLGGWILEVPGNVLHWSDEVRAIHEVADDFEPTLAQAFDYYPPEFRGQVMAYVKCCKDDGTPFSFEHELITATGKRVWVLAIGEAVRNDQGVIVAVQGAFQDINARKQAEASVQASQRRFREMADTFPFIVWTAEPDGNVNYKNHVFSDYIGLAQDNKSDIDWLSYVHPEDIGRCTAAWQTAVQTGGVYLIDYRLKEAASGDYHWHRVRAAPVRNVAGQIIKWYGTAIDMNETKSLEQQSKSFANRLNTTLESITDGFFILDKNWTFTFLNTQAERMLGRARQELLGKTFWLEFPPAPGTVFEQEYLKAIKEGVPVHFQDYYPPPLNCWFAVSAYPSEEGLAVYFRDVTQIRKDFSQLQLLRTAVSRLNDIVLITEAEPFDEPGPRIVFVNEAFERRTGYTQAEVIGKTPRLLQGPKTDRAELDRIGRALKAWQPVRAELINYAKSGEEFWLELDIVPIADSKGWFTHWVAVERDITERKLAQESILRLNSELEDRVERRTQQLAEANKELEAFSYSVSHDLRSPLATINGFTQLLLKSDKEQLSEKSKHYLNRIHAGSTKMGELIDGLLSLAKLSRGKMNRQEVDLTVMSSKMVQELRSAEPDRMVDVTIQTDLKVNGDATMVTVIMQNLIANAWKYSGKTLLARVEIGSETTADGVQCIYVRDNGAGFDMAYAEKLFEVFQRLHQDSDFKGTGIGLANVKRVVERHGGRIWAQAASGEGATFRFTLDRMM